MSFLEKMREKPRHVKGQYAFVSALSATLVIGLVWGLSLPARFEESTIANKTVPQKQEEQGTGFIDLVGTARTQLGNVFQGTDGLADIVIPGEEEDTIAQVINGQQDASEETEGEEEKEQTTTQKNTEPRTVLIGVSESKDKPNETAPDNNEAMRSSEGTHQQSKETPHEPRVILIGTTPSSKGVHDDQNTN